MKLNRRKFISGSAAVGAKCHSVCPWSVPQRQDQCRVCPLAPFQVAVLATGTDD